MFLLVTLGERRSCEVGLPQSGRPLHVALSLEAMSSYAFVLILHVMTKSWGPSWGKQLSVERPRETAET